ncbi:hypothetical protein ACFE04_018141 [Oxalis oulophora]
MPNVNNPMDDASVLSTDDSSHWADEYNHNIISNDLKTSKRIRNAAGISGGFHEGRKSSLRRRSKILPSRYNDSVLVLSDSDNESDSSFDDDDFINKSCRLGGYTKTLDKKFNYGSSELYSNNYDYSRNFSMGSENFRPKKGSRKKIQRVGMRKGLYKPEDFPLGDIVWAKCGKRYPAWPAVVIDPILQAPEAILRSSIPGATCVMFFGYLKNGTQRDYAWLKEGMIFPFGEFMDRFQNQKQLHNPSEFQIALEEAILAENGNLDMNQGTVQVANLDSHPSYSNQDEEYYYTENQDDFPTNASPCQGCSSFQPCKTARKTKEFFCDHCAKFRKSKQFCGICKKIWRHSDGGNWVCCDSCNVWVHAECDNISSELFKGYVELSWLCLKDLEHIDYYCPDCKAKFNSKSLTVEKEKPGDEFTGHIEQTTLPDRIDVICNSLEGTYFPKLHVIICKCGSCGSKKQTPSVWERHAGSRSKKWKHSVKVKSSKMPLGKWIPEYNAHEVDTLKLDEQKLFTVLPTPSGVFAAKNLLQNQNGTETCSMLVSAKGSEHPEPLKLDMEPLSAARC